MRFIYFTFVFQMDEVMTRKDFEVMAPVGSYESLYAALQGGADSVYFGVEGLNMRARSSANFTLEDLKNIVSVCLGYQEIYLIIGSQCIHLVQFGMLFDNLQGLGTNRTRRA